MARCLVFSFLFLALALLTSRTAAALTLYHLWQIMLPHNLLPEEGIPEHLPRGSQVTATPSIEETGDDEEFSGSPDARVDFGTKAWPYVYYARRDRKGTVDWGTMSWPYIYYSRRDGKGHKEAAEPNDGAKPVNVHPGRKGGSEFRS